MNRNFLTGQRLLAMAILGGLALNYPILALFNREAMRFGIPVLYLYLFAIWTLLIVLLGLIIERR
jgi:hypothetical protein